MRAVRPTLRALFITGVLAMLSACAGFGVYKIDIQQGNLITQEQLAKVKPGMNRIDVRNALGTPLLQDAFHANRWDYYFSDDRATKYGPFGRETQRFQVTIMFADDKVSKIEDLDGYKYFFENGDWMMIRASGTEPVLRLYAESSTEDSAFDILKESKNTLLN